MEEINRIISLVKKTSWVFIFEIRVLIWGVIFLYNSILVLMLLEYVIINKDQWYPTPIIKVDLFLMTFVSCYYVMYLWHKKYIRDLIIFMKKHGNDKECNKCLSVEMKTRLADANDYEKLNIIHRWVERQIYVEKRSKLIY
ncbi:hypothetical protein [Rosenbergiella collisarenosi]|uniref:hypothetical protein n=1 Tax=Rosenbergiella collisarenosi TaxID=1544695 RepID=UPI001F4DA86D|nr:hypothetical protein [Rosenbergiella collisarenosi]